MVPRNCANTCKMQKYISIFVFPDVSCFIKFYLFCTIKGRKTKCAAAQEIYLVSREAGLTRKCLGPHFVDCSQREKIEKEVEFPFDKPSAVKKKT